MWLDLANWFYRQGTRCADRTRLFWGAVYGGAQGRLTSPDPWMGSAHILNPQSWNRDGYSLNDPLRYSDSFGLYVWDNSLGGCASDDELRNQRSRRTPTISSTVGMTSAMHLRRVQRARIPEFRPRSAHMEQRVKPTGLRLQQASLVVKSGGRFHPGRRRSSRAQMADRVSPMLL